MTFFIPALPLALPDWIFSLQNECDRENGFEQQNSTGTTGQQNNSETADELKNNTGTAADQHVQNTGQTELLPLLTRPNNAESFADNNAQAECDHSRNGYNQSQEELSKMIPVDDSSPMTFSNLFLGFVETLPDLGLSFNVKCAIVWLCGYSSVFWLQFGLYRTLKKTYINEIIKKHLSVWDVFNRPFLIATFHDAEGPLNIFLVVSLAVLGFIPVFFSRPEDFILEEGIICYMCEEHNRMNTLAMVFPNSDRRSVGDEIRRHLKILHHVLCDIFLAFKELGVYDFCSCTCIRMRQASRLRHVICVLLRLVSFPIILLLTVLRGAIVLSLFFGLSLGAMIIYSPLGTLVLFTFQKVGHLGDNLDLENVRGCVLIVLGCVLTLIFVPFYILILALGNFVTLFNWCNFIIDTLVYLTMGVVLNVGVVTPFVAFFPVITTNIYLCYANMQNKYKEVKKMILKWRKELQINDSDPEGTIRIQLFWFVCDRVLPMKSEICRMFRNMALIITFLFVAVYSIAVFGNEYNVSVVFSTMYVFFSGAIAALVFKGLSKGYKFIGWEKINIEREVKLAVTGYKTSPVTDVRPESADNV